MKVKRFCKKRNAAFLYFAVSLFFAMSCSAENYYVSTQGNDANPGTKERPFATIGRAQKAVRESIAHGLSEDINVFIRGGVYRITKPFVFSVQDGGSEKHAVTYKAFPGDTPVISGGRIIHGWKEHEDGTWRTLLPETKSGRWNFRELFVNGKRAQRARHPDSGYLRIAGTSEDRTSYFLFNPGDIPINTTAHGTELIFLHDWSISRVLIQKIDHARHELHPKSKIGRQHHMMVIDGYEKHPRYFLENHPSFCDAPGEWYISDNELIYRPREGETIGKIEAIAPLAEQLLLVRGDEVNNRPVRNLHFQGLVFEHCAFYPPAEGYAGTQATFHADNKGQGMRNYVTPAVEFTFAENCRFQDGVVRHVGGSGIILGSRTKHCAVIGSVISDVSGNGIMIGETRNRKINSQPWWKSAPEQVAENNSVTNNLIQHCGVQFFGAVGLWVGIAAKTEIAHNEVRHLPYTGVSVGWMWNPTPTPCKMNLIAHNHIHHVMQILSDGGGIYTLGLQPGTVLRGNHIHDVPINLGRAESNGMFLDEGTTDIVIEKNVIYKVDKSPLRFHKAGQNIVRENVLAVKPSVPYIQYNRTDPKNIHQIHNTIITMDIQTSPELAHSIDKIKDTAGLEWHYRRNILDKRY